MSTVKSIDPKGLARLMESKPDLCLIDVRTPAEFDSVHAAGAKPLPLTDLDPGLFMAGRGEADSPVYIICKGGARSMKAAETFVSKGFTNVVNVSGGTDAWVAAGLPVERGGRNVLPLDRQVQMTAGAICLAGVILGTWYSAGFYALSAMVGLGLFMAGTTGFCPMARLLERMPWNQSACRNGSCCSSKK